MFFTYWHISRGRPKRNSRVHFFCIALTRNVSVSRRAPYPLGHATSTWNSCDVFLFSEFEMDESEDTIMMPLWHQILLRTADAFWSCLMVFPLCVVYWASTWKLMDATLGPETSWLSGVISLSIGTVFGLAG